MSLFRWFSEAVHKYFVWLLIGTYVGAALLPQPGLWVRHLSITELGFKGESASLSAPTIMLALLLFNAGFGTGRVSWSRLKERLSTLCAGVSGNLLVPVAFVFIVSYALRWWHNEEETQNILVGLALVASMPIAGSSTAWSQNANGDLTISLGLVILSTLASPLTTPLILHAISFAASGEYSQDLRDLARNGTKLFLVLFVLVPSLLGLGIRRLISAGHAKQMAQQIKLVNLMVLLLLNYSNAAVALPRVVKAPDPDFISIVLTVVTILCLVAFGSGWAIARLLGVDRAQRIALMFGLGMNNNGTGLVLASLSLADHPRVMLPIILYNLIQHLVAAGIDSGFYRTRGEEDEASSAPHRLPRPSGQTSAP
jgi:BASS family bile acid:Na+ symporter